MYILDMLAYYYYVDGQNKAYSVSSWEIDKAMWVETTRCSTFCTQSAGVIFFSQHICFCTNISYCHKKLYNTITTLLTII